MTSLSTGETYAYDANGNMTQRVEGGLTYTQTFRQAQCIAFDAENRLISVTVSGQTTQFLYGVNGTLVKKTKPDGSKTIYAGGNVYEVDKTSGGAVSRTLTYYPAGGAIRIDNSVYYVLKDRLGSVYATTDASGNLVGETRLSTGTMFTDKLFTSQREIAGLGIYHYGARFYLPKLGRFLSADTIIQNLANPQLLNRYSYVNNNPLRYTDPTGHMMTVGDDGDCYICSYPGDDGGTGGGEVAMVEVLMAMETMKSEAAGLQHQLPRLPLLQHFVQWWPSRLWKFRPASMLQKLEGSHFGDIINLCYTF